MEEKYAIFYYKKAGELNYKVRVQNAKTYEYVKDIEVCTDNITSMLESLKNEFIPSYYCEVKY